MCVCTAWGLNPSLRNYMRGSVQMLMDAHVGEGGIKNSQNYAHVINGRPQKHIDLEKSKLQEH